MDKKLGVLGGMGPMATIDFVKRMVEKSPATSDQEHIPMVISNNPLIPDRTKHLLENGLSPFDMMLNDLITLKKSAVTKVVIPCNTAHYWLDKLYQAEPFSYISLIDTVINEAANRAMKKVAVLATNATIVTEMYAKALEQREMETLLPDSKQQQQVMEGIYAVKAGQVEKGRSLIEPVFDSLIEQGADGVILGCTEIPLAFDNLAAEKKQKSLDSLDLLANQCVKYYYG